ncbi:deoxyribose-phosphate aldolase [Frankia sp. AiPs1]|nr:deoxyribose-phosphate aldolase [Frankia sp. AiPa1]MCL9757723.1 deoxyribose-phosphate aldolase [Frankia sp. AiPa1]
MQRMTDEPASPDSAARPAEEPAGGTTAGGRRRAEVARLVDHTLLAPAATGEEVLALCAEAAKLGVGAVCVAPTHVYLAAASARRDGQPEQPAFAVASVVGFPHGNHLTVIKAEEARRAVADGATEIDMVIDIANAMDENWRAIETEISEVRLSVPPHVVLKVILETALLPDANIVAACRAAEAGGAEYVKTSTGFHPAGGASVRAVRSMAGAVGGRLGIKASGGIRTAEQATAMLEAGATRLGLSASADVLAGFPA